MSMKSYWKRGEPMVLATAGTLGLILIMTLTLVGVILFNGLGYFWPHELVRFELNDGSAIIGQITAHERHAISGVKRLQLKVANRDLYGQDFRWIDESAVTKRELPRDALLLERKEYGNFFGYLVNDNGQTLTVRDAAGATKVIARTDIVCSQYPNAMSLSGKALAYLERVRELLLDQPRESNTEGGLFPAIFGTVMMVLLMSLFSLPFGVIAAVYLREYARDGWMVRLTRIAVNNLAGVPSIVFGVFGLGFFVYGIGGNIDRLFFADRLPTPTFGTGGILWASLTLALLTVPVVIVATEESLASIPKGIREGSLALGATRFQTLLRVLLPMATPGIMTGVVLSMARAAGEVAPLMMVGVVKLAPTLPIDGQFPYFHMDRKFMHLGFHIYDVGFQSPNVEAAKPMVYVTTMLLLLIVIVAAGAAIHFRTGMRKRYTSSHF